MNDVLPLDKDVHYGKLENGLTYYVKHNEEPKNRAYLQLVVNSGSIMEDEDQKGLAHMCEHMAFNGTKNFPKHKLVEFLESLGMRFGADLNAYTSFDETVYMIEIPLDSAGFFTQGMQVIYDWATNVSYETDEINAERGVIFEEWRLGNGAQDRLRRQTFPALLYNSKYADRLPIGDTAVFKYCSPDNLRRFYNDWYRPDLQAIVLVGDFDAEKVTAQVIELFSQIPARTNQKERIYPEVPDHQNTIVKVATDKESPYTLLSIYIKNDFQVVKTYADFKNDLVNILASGMLNMRLSEIAQKPESPFSYVGVDDGDFIGKKSAFTFYALPKNDKILDAVKVGAEEMQRAKEFGFTQSELDRQKNVLLSNMKKQYDDRNKISSENWANAFHQNFSISQTPAMSIDFEYNLDQKLLALIDLKEVNQAINDMILDKNTVIILTAPEITVPSEQEVLDAYNNAKTAKLNAYEEEKVAENLITNEPKAGSVVAEKKDDITGTTTWTLNNGVKVVLKSTDFKDNQILMTAYSVGGYSLYPNDIFTAQNCANISDNSGVGDFNSVQLNKFMSDKNASCSPFISVVTEGFKGNSTVEDFSTMMQLIYLYFTAPRFDEDAFQTFIQQQQTILANKSNTPQAIWRDSLYANMYNHNPLMAQLTLNDLPKISNKKAEEIYKQRFSDPGSFTFVFVGNLDVNTVKPLIEKYLGSLPAIDHKEKIAKLDFIIPDETKKVYAKIGSDPKSMVYTILHGTAKQNYTNQVYLKALSFVMTDSLLDQIREKNQWTYSISASSNFASVVNNQYTMGIFYSSSPENVDKVNDVIMRIAHSFATIQITDEELQKTVEKLKREHETNLRNNEYWLNELYFMSVKNSKPEFITSFDKIVNSLDKKTVMKSAKKFMHDNYLSVILAPAE